MILDPQGGALPRRGTGSWGGDDRARSETHRNSVELNNSNRLSRSPAESPRSAHPAASPTTSTIATPTTSNSTINFAPPPLMPPSGISYPGATKEQKYAGVFQEASFAYCKYLEALHNYKSAEKDSKDHAEHFNLFPVMKERYEGNVKAAKKQLSIAHEALRNKSGPLEDLCKLLFKEHAINTGIENAIGFLQKIKSELGNGSLAQFVKANVPVPVPPPLGPSKNEFEQLRDELLSMKKKQEEEEKMRQNLTNEFHNYKNNQTDKTRTCMTRLSKIEQELKEQTKGTEERLEVAMSLLTEVKGNVEKLQNAATAKSSADVVMSDAGNDIETTPEKVKSVAETLETIQKNLLVTQQEMAQTALKCASDIKGLEQKISKLDIKEVQATQVQGALAPQEYATKSDVARLEDHMRQQDNLIDNVRAGIEGDTVLVSEAVDSLGAALEQNKQETAGKIQALEQSCKDQAGTIQLESKRFQALDQSLKDQFANLVSLQERGYAIHIGKIDKGYNELKGAHEKLVTDIGDIGNKLGYVESHFEGHAMAISHLDQKMTNFTTKDFYDRVIQELIKINPTMFNQSQQLNGIWGEIKAIKDTIRNLSGQMQRIANANLSPRPAPDSASAQDGASNGTLKPDSPEGPAASLTSAIADVEALRTRIEGVDKELKDHITAYTKKINDIKNWTVSASERLALHTESAAAISEDIRALREYLGSMNSHSGSPVQIPNSAGTDRWRAVPNYQDNIPGISSSSTEDGNIAGNSNGNGNF